MGRSGEGTLLFSFYNRTEKAKVIPQPWCGRGNAAHAQPRGSPAGSAPSTLPFPSPRRRLTPPGPPSPVGGPAGRVTPRMEGHELATPEETGVSGLAPDPPGGRRGKGSSSGFQAGPAPLSSLPHFIREYASLSGKEKQPPGKSDLFLQL